MSIFHMSAKKLFSISLAVLLMALLPVSALADHKAVVTSSTRVYAAASKSARSARLSKGTVVTVEDTANGVAKIRNGRNVGYTDASDLKKLSTTEVVVTGKVYQSAKTSARSATISKGTTVTLLGVSGSWAKIERSGVTGYVKKTILEKYYEPANDKAEVQKPAVKDPVISGSMTRAEKVIAYAQSRMDCPYVYGKSGPDSFDCAGLVRYAYKQIGISLTHSAYGQGYNEGTRVSYENLKKGDIVCFNTNGSDDDLVDHTGIYIGGGKFVHASSAGGKVMVSSLSSGYYKRVFSWARRVL